MSSDAKPSEKERLLAALAAALQAGTLRKLTLGAPSGRDPTLQRLIVRPVLLRQGPRLSFVWRHATRDVTKNHAHDEALALLAELIGGEFGTAHLLTTEATLQLDVRPNSKPRLTRSAAAHSEPPSLAHDRSKARPLDPAAARWLATLGVTTEAGKARPAMQGKLRQVQRFVEVLAGLMDDCRRTPSPVAGQRAAEHSRPARNPDLVADSALRADKRDLTHDGQLELVDMGCGKGYLTFAACDWLRGQGIAARLRGVEARAELVEAANRAARQHGFDELSFEVGTIDSLALERVDLLLALHACDTATDDAIAKGIAAGAALIVVAPCCHKELRPQLETPPPLRAALRHGILLERHAELVTDALRAALLEHAGYTTKVFEFVTTEHTAKNLMIAATRRAGPAARPETLAAVRELAAFHGVREQRLASALGVELR